MRQIKFRALCAITGVWRYGFYYTSKGNHIIRDEQDKESIVLPATVGQFTGLKDGNGKEIFEGDKMKKPGNKNVYTVVYFDAEFYLSHKGVNHRMSWTANDGEIIGNIHDVKEEI